MPVLYKYRDFSDKNHKKIILDQEVFLASRRLFNDPFDCNIPVRYKKEELTEENIFQKSIQVLKYNHPDWSSKQLHEAAYEVQRNGHLGDNAHYDYADKYNRNITEKNIGVLSLSKIKNNYLLWSHYAKHHTGFCVGFDKDLLIKACKPKGTLVHGEVHCCDNFPEFSFNGDMMEEGVKSFFYKPQCWAYEKEYRIIKYQGAMTTVKLPKEAIKEVIFGAMMDDATKIHLIEQLLKIYPNLSISEMSLSQKNFSLVERLVYAP